MVFSSTESIFSQFIRFTCILFESNFFLWSSLGRGGAEKRIYLIKLSFGLFQWYPRLSFFFGFSSQPTLPHKKRTFVLFLFWKSSSWINITNVSYFYDGKRIKNTFVVGMVRYILSFLVKKHTNFSKVVAVAWPRVRRRVEAYRQLKVEWQIIFGEPRSTVLIT